MNNPDNSSAMLAGYKVLDLSDNKAYTCGRFLASLGAEVIKVEEPGSTVTQSEHDIPAATKWLANNVGKKCITLNLDHKTGRELFRQLATKVDFIVESYTPGFLKTLDLDYPQLQKLNPGIILISISPFGQTGPFAQYLGGELVASAMGGTLETCGYADDTPVLEALDACIFHANAAASLGAMLAHRERGESGLGQHVDCSIQEVSASRNTNNLSAYQFDGRKLSRSGNKVRFGVANVRVIWELSDGYCFHSMMTGKFGASANEALSNWMSEEGFENPMKDVDWESYDRASLPEETRLEWEGAIDEFFKSQSKQSIATEGYKRGIRATIAQTPEDILVDKHLTSRDFLKAVDVPENQSVDYPNYFVRLNEGNYRLAQEVPDIGEHNAEIYKALLDVSPEQLALYIKEGVL